MRKRPKRCSDTRGLCTPPPFSWLGVLLAPSTADWAAQPGLLTVCTVGLAVTRGFGSARKRFLCRRCQGRRRETESSRCLPGPSALVTTSKRAGEAPTKPGLSSQPLTRSAASSRGREWLLEGGCAELKAHFSLFLSPQAQTRGGCSAGAQGVVQVRVAQSRAAEHQPGSGFRGGRARNPSSGFTDQEVQHQMSSHNSCSTFGKNHEVQGFIQVQTEMYMIFTTLSRSPNPTATS